MKKALSLLLCVLFCLPLFAAAGIRVGAKYITVKNMVQSDDAVYAPGVYDLYVYTDAVEPTYTWYVRVGKGSSASGYMGLEDNEFYSGVHTSHLSLITHDGLEYSGDGSGWDGLYFSCLVTDKDGTKAYGPDLNMIIYSHEQLLEGLRYKNVGFITSGVKNSISYREENGVGYYDCYLDQEIELDSVFSEIPEGSFKERFYDSEGELKTEYEITENNQTTLLTSLTGSGLYQPKKAGMGEVQVTANLALYMNGERMETIDSRSYVVNVLTPEGIGAAYTKTATALKDSLSFHAITITNLSKDTYVRLLEDRGSFWKVAVPSIGYLGYVSTTALDLMENIGAVSIGIAEPTAYQSANTAVRPEDPELYSAEARWNQEMWYDKTAGRFLSASDVFYPNHRYQLTIWLSAGEGMRFNVVNGAPQVKALVNGLSANCRKAYEQDPEKIVELSIDFDHVHDLNKVNRVYPDCTTAGKQLYYHCDGCGWNFEDAAAKTRITDQDWGVIPALGHRESEWKTNGENHYKICLRRECGAVIPESTGAHSFSASFDHREKNGHAHYCTVCGMHDSLCAHRPGPAATETTPQLCLDCAYMISPATGIQYGDVDANGEIALSDLMMLAKYVAAWSLGEEFRIAAADCDGSGEIGLGDILQLAKYIAAWEVPLGAQT